MTTHQVVSFNFYDNFQFSSHFLEIIDSLDFNDWWDCEGKELFGDVSSDLAHKIFEHCRSAFIEGIRIGAIDKNSENSGASA